MRQNTFNFILKGHIFTATVRIIAHDGFVEYYTTPSDKDLKAIYGTQLITVYPGRPFQSSITATDVDSKEYNRALITGLHTMLHGKH